MPDRLLREVSREEFMTLEHCYGKADPDGGPTRHFEVIKDEPVTAPSLSLAAWGATPEQADAIFTAAMDAAYEAAPDGVAVDGVAALAPGVTWPDKETVDV